MKEKNSEVNLEVLDISRNVSINDEKKLKRVIKKTILKSKIGRSLNKLDNMKPISDEKRRKILRNARNSGNFHLNGFADVYRDMIKISYVTLYRRIWKNKDVFKTLVNLGYISNAYKTVDKLDLKDVKEKQKYWKIQVSYEKRRDFIKFIKENFLTSEQRRG